MTELESLTIEIEALKDHTDRLDDELQLQLGKLEELYRLRTELICVEDATLPQCKVHYTDIPGCEGYAFVIINQPGEGYIQLRQVGSSFVYPIYFVWNAKNSRYEPEHTISNTIHLRDVPAEWMPQNLA